MKKRSPKKAQPFEAAEPNWNLCLYVAGPNPKSDAAFHNLHEICEEYLAGRYQINVVDLLKNPQIAREDQILAVPTVVRKWPLPIRKIIGDLSNTQRVLASLGLRPQTASRYEVRKGEKNV